jgi:hypothetical protein
MRETLLLVCDTSLWQGTAADSTASASMTNGGFASNGPRGLQGQRTWRLLTITRRYEMTPPAIHPASTWPRAQGTRYERG